MSAIKPRKVQSEYDIVFTSDTPDHDYHLVKNTQGQYHHFISEEGARTYVNCSPYGSCYIV